MMNAITIYNAEGRQVFGLDSETQLALYKRGQRVFQLPGNLTLRIACDLPNAVDPCNQESADYPTATRCGVETTNHHSGIYDGG
jgi:hypothetical protein